MGSIIYSSGILGAYTIKVALGKCNLDFTTALASGILYICACAAVMLAARAKDVTGKLLCCFFYNTAFCCKRL